jgi:hypothetical protein
MVFFSDSFVLDAIIIIKNLPNKKNQTFHYYFLLTKLLSIYEAQTSTRTPDTTRTLTQRHR